MNPTSQIPLDLAHDPSFAMADFIVSSSNEAATQLVQSWPDWPGHVVALVGPPASGKSHLARAWAADVGAVILGPEDEFSGLAPGASVLIESVENGDWNESNLFHLFNWIKEISGSLLITSRLPPNRWQIALPDLKSRLATVAVGEIAQPDDNLLMILMVKLFSDRQLQVNAAVINYIVPRVERSFSAVTRLVDQLDKAALANKGKVTRNLAKMCLLDDQNREL